MIFLSLLINAILLYPEHDRGENLLVCLQVYGLEGSDSNIKN